MVMIQDKAHHGNIQESELLLLLPTVCSSCGRSILAHVDHLVEVQRDFDAMKRSDCGNYNLFTVAYI